MGLPPLCCCPTVLLPHCRLEKLEGGEDRKGEKREWRGEREEGRGERGEGRK